MSYSTAEIQGRKTVAINAELADTRRRMDNAKFYRDAPGLSVSAHKQWCGVIADFESQIFELENCTSAKAGDDR